MGVNDHLCCEQVVVSNSPPGLTRRKSTYNLTCLQTTTMYYLSLIRTSMTANHLHKRGGDHLGIAGKWSRKHSPLNLHDSPSSPHTIWLSIDSDEVLLITGQSIDDCKSSAEEGWRPSGDCRPVVAKAFTPELARLARKSIHKLAFYRQR